MGIESDFIEAGMAAQKAAKAAVALGDAMRLSDNDLVTQDNQNNLMFWRDMFRTAQFDIGDIAAYEVKRMAQSGIAVTHDRVFSAVGRFCGKGPRTVRYYYEQAIFYKPEIRQEFNELPFSHFVLAHKYGEHWQTILKYSQANVGITEDFLEKWVYAQGWHRALRPVQVDIDSFRGENTDMVLSGDLPEEYCETSHDDRGSIIEFHSGLYALQGFIARIQDFRRNLPNFPLEQVDKDEIESRINFLLNKLEASLSRLV